MKQFACGDVIPGCDATFRSDDEDGILGVVAAHAAAAHGITEVSDDVVAAIRSHITDA